MDPPLFRTCFIQSFRIFRRLPRRPATRRARFDNDGSSVVFQSRQHSTQDVSHLPRILFCSVIKVCFEGKTYLQSNHIYYVPSPLSCCNAILVSFKILLRQYFSLAAFVSIPDCIQFRHRSVGLLIRDRRRYVRKNVLHEC
jgi:hypothetical protein